MFDSFGSTRVELRVNVRWVRFDDGYLRFEDDVDLRFDEDQISYENKCSMGSVRRGRRRFSFRRGSGMDVRWIRFDDNSGGRGLNDDFDFDSPCTKNLTNSTAVQRLSTIQLFRLIDR